MQVHVLVKDALPWWKQCFYGIWTDENKEFGKTYSSSLLLCHVFFYLTYYSVELNLDKSYTLGFMYLKHKFVKIIWFWNFSFLKLYFYTHVIPFVFYSGSTTSTWWCLHLSLIKHNFKYRPTKNQLIWASLCVCVFSQLQCLPNDWHFIEEKEDGYRLICNYEPTWDSSSKNTWYDSWIIHFFSQV